MGRIRTIKPEFPQSESIGRLSRDARLLFIQLWTLVDDEGRARAAPRMLAGLLYPYDDDVPALIEGWLAELDAEGCTRRYTRDGSSYIEIQNWSKHQKVDHKSASKFPPPPDDIAKPREPSRSLAPDLDLGPGPGLDHIPCAEGLGAIAKVDEGSKGKTPLTEVELRASFDRFTEAFPRQREPDAAFRAFRQVLGKGADPDAVIAAAAAFRAEHLARGTEPRFIPYPASWLRDGGFKDVPETAPAKESGAATDTGVFFKAGSPQFSAWDRHYRETRGRGPPMNKDGGWYFPSEYPPTGSGASH